MNDSLDHAALAGGIATFEEYHHFEALVLDPLLQLDKFDLQPSQLPLVDLLLDLAGVFSLGLDKLGEIRGRRFIGAFALA